MDARAVRTGVQAGRGSGLARDSDKDATDLEDLGSIWSDRGCWLLGHLESRRREEAVGRSTSRGQGWAGAGASRSRRGLRPNSA